MLLASEEQSNLHGDRATPHASRLSHVDTLPPTATTGPASPTMHHLQPRATPPPTCCSPNQVIIELSTTVVIKDYQRFYSADINSFSPTYFTTDDGSLITPALTADLWNSNINLLLTAALAVLFLRNIAVAMDYLRRGKMKNKTLFYLLLTSQALAPASAIPSLFSFFNQYINCTVVITLSSTVGSVALAILLTGIIGIKTFKCMNDSKIVAGVIIVVELGHMAFVILDAVAMRGARRIAGSCLRTSDLRYTRISVALQMGECCFMMLCFVYTCIKYRKTPGARGRISLRMSMEDVLLDFPDGLGQGDPRGETLRAQHDNPSEKVDLPVKDINQGPPRPSNVLISSQLPVNHPEDGRSHARKSMASSFSRLSRLLSNMVNLRKVMRDELLYTCVITVVITLALVFTFTGVNVKNGLSVTGWITLTWGLVSVFIIHSFGRVVRRHERESVVRYATSRAISRAALSTPGFCRTNDFWISRNSPTMRSRRDSRISQNTAHGNPFSDTQQLRQHGQRPSYQSGVTSSTASNLPSPLEPIVGITGLDGSMPLPSSARESNFPTSGHGTPVVIHESVEGNIQGFSQSWLLAHDTGSQLSTSSTDRNYHKTLNM
ncbi:hypothetical protein P691DRAFT_803749 [Macrolepiota fuliginosa MF-IS2]|uniref:Uncharacterized protein n=1 Tax=Macrolepiota fuliginosa MF-IS2 TaxID=1400762 RepID=A0A9P6C584_9AGAR|nr:hypothetical protein P691DRAFT_803749 [Macrolepiota fuliginosa MF-IS2]